MTGLLVFTLALHEFRGREHGAEVFKLVMGAPPSDVRRIMAEGLAWKGWALPLLKQAAQEPADTLRGLNARLALIDSDARHVSTLAKVMLEADAPVFTTIRKALAGRTDIPVHQFQAVLRDSAATHGHKLRAYVALAAFSPEDVLVGELGSEAAQWLLTAEGNPGEWAGQLQPVASRLGVALEAALHADDAPLNLQRTTAALASLHAGDSTRLIRLLPLAPPASVSPLTSELERIPGAGELLEEAARQGLARLGQKGSQILDAGGEASFRGQANMLLACLILKKEQHVWPCLKRGADRTLRSFIFLNAADAGVPAELLLNRLFNEMDEGIVQGLLLALCGYPHSALSVSGQQKAMKWLRDTYTRHPDGGVHSSIATLLKRWSLHKDLELLNRALPRSPAPAPGMRWWVTPSGVDMRIVCLAEDHITALGAQEVTEAEFTALCQKPASPIPPSAKSVPGLAATGVKWNDAALYCMELSSVEGLAPDQQSYVRTGDELRPQSETSDRQGYRLATKAEWLEAALPNNARSRWDFGNAASLASSFAWLAATSNGKSHPVAGLLPNENGLWDSIGNVAEWSHDGSRADQWTSVFLLGGSFATLLSETSQVHMRTAGTGTLHPEAGFRLARRLIRDGQPRSR